MPKPGILPHDSWRRAGKALGTKPSSVARTHRRRATSPRCPSRFHFSLRFHSEEEKAKVAWEAKFPRVRVRAAHPVLRSESPPKMLPLCCKAEDGREEKVNEPQAEKV